MAGEPDEKAKPAEPAPAKPPNGDTAPEPTLAPVKLEAVPVPPMPSSGTPGAVNLAMGMQIVQPSLLNFDRLDRSIQEKMLELVAQMDRNAFDIAHKDLELRYARDHKRIDTNTAERRTFFRLCGWLAGGTLAASLAITAAFVVAGQHQLAYTIMMSGVGVISAFMGGAGLTKVMKSGG